MALIGSPSEAASTMLGAEQSWSKDHQAAMNELWDELCKMEPDPENPSLLAIQVLSLNPVQAVGDAKAWSLWFGKANFQLEKAIQEFTTTESKEELGQRVIYRTLAFDKCLDIHGAKWGSWDEQEDVGRNEYVEPKFHRDELKQQELEALSLLPRGEVDKKFDIWKSYLKHYFPEGGSTLWLTISHRSADDIDMQSAIYLVFGNNQIPNKECCHKIAEHARDFLYDRVILFYEDALRDEPARFRRALEQALRVDEGVDSIDALNAAGILERMPLIEGRYPFLIEGERGTGKLTTALYLLEQCENFIQTSSDITVFDCGMFRDWSGSQVKEYLQRRGIVSICEDDNLVRLEVPIIIDDVQLANEATQHVFYRIVKDIYARAAERNLESFDKQTMANPLPRLIFTIEPSLTDCLANRTVISDLDILLPSKVTLKTLHQKLGSSDDPIAELRDLVSRYWTSLSPLARSGHRRNDITDEQLKKWSIRPWPDNFKGLKREIVQYMINGS